MELLAVAFVCWVSVSAVTSSNVCTEILGTTPKLNLKVPVEFTADIEVVDNVHSSVQNVEMYYDDHFNFTRLTVYNNQKKKDHYLYFDDKEVLNFDYSQGRGTCTVTDLKKGLNEFLFVGYTPGQASSSFPAPLVALHFMGQSGFNKDQIVQKPEGTVNIRGKPAKMYSSCQKWTSENSDIVLNVTHYFADSSVIFPHMYWETDVSTLLAVDVNGVGKLFGQSDQTIRQTYNYFNFRIGIDGRSRYETPNGIVCKGRKNDKPFPKLPNHIHFTSESIDQINGGMSSMEEIYDFDRSLAIFRMPEHVNSNKGFKSLINVLDFKSGVKYTKDKVCVKSQIANGAVKLPVYSLANGQAKMLTPAQFFQADAKQFAYLGKKQLRGMNTDSWVAQEEATGLVSQWHFAPAVYSWNDGNADYRKNKYRIPVKVMTWPQMGTKAHVTSNLFHVDFNQVRPDFVDVSDCFLNKQYFQLVLKGSKADILASDLETFKYEAYKQIEKVGQVNWLHINKMKLYYLTNDVVLTFIIGSDTNNDLQQITNRVTQAAKNGQLVLNVVDPKFQNFTKTLKVDSVVADSVFNDNVFSTSGNMKPIPNSNKQTGGKNGKNGGGNTGYSPGAMGGLAIAMLLVGIGGGVGAGFAHSHFKG